MSDKEIKGIECRHVFHFPFTDRINNDVHLVKEQITYTDGTQVPNVRLIRNFKRPFYITREKYRNHKDKKEWEKIENLAKYECTQLELTKRVAEELNNTYFKDNLRKLANSPYLYGTDISSSALIKQLYKTKYPDLQTFYTYATLDIESSMDGNSDIILITICFNNKVFTSIYRPFINGLENIEERLREKINQYLTSYIDVNSYEFEFSIQDTQLNVIKVIFDRLHQLKPDFLSIWNIDYDINQIAKTLEKNGIDPKDIFSDPSVPYELRYYHYKKGKTQKVTASGKYSPISPANQWHTVFTPSSFYIIDAMCTYRRNRLAKPEEQSYSLDSILNKVLGLRKLKFKEADGYVGGEWHEFMQSEYPLEYIVYNIFDSISMVELEKVTKDLAVSLPLFCGISDFSTYDSQPSRLADSFHNYCLENGVVIAATGADMKTEFDSKTLPLKGWISNLPAYLVVDNGLQLIKENPELHTNIRIHGHDLDIKSAYPITTVISNISKETTISELVSIEGCSIQKFGMENINLFSGVTNSLEYCQQMFNFPTLPNILEEFKKST